MALMGVDVGGTGVKALIYSEDGQTPASAHREYDRLDPVPGAFSGADEAIRSIVNIKRVFEPDKDSHAYYSEMAEKVEKLHAAPARFE